MWFRTSFTVFFMKLLLFPQVIELLSSLSGWRLQAGIFSLHLCGWNPSAFFPVSAQTWTLIRFGYCHVKGHSLAKCCVG